MTPTRFLLPVDPSRRPAAERLGRFLGVGDTLADDAVASIASLGSASRGLVDRALGPYGSRAPEVPLPLRLLVENAREIPTWVDERAAERGGEVVMRTGLVGGMVLGLKSLIYGYASPGGNKPLAFSGRLTERATSRLNETARFVQATCSPGTLTPGGAGWRITLKVRLMHAQVRRLILASGRWDAGQWGHPINQHDMAATALLFSQVFVDGVRQLGAQVSRDEEEDVLHVWRWSAHLLGVDPELQVETPRAARRLSDLIQGSQGPPDDDSRALTAALLGSGDSRQTEAQKKSRRAPPDVAYAVCRTLIGDELASRLAVPATSWTGAVPAFVRALQVARHVRRSLPSADASALDRGRRYWQRVVDIGFHDASAEFDLPQVLAVTAA